jgi:hypothetical protein
VARRRLCDRSVAGPRRRVKTENLANARMPMRDILGQATIGVAQHVGAPMPIALGRKPSRGAQAPRTQLKESLFA